MTAENSKKFVLLQGVLSENFTNKFFTTNSGTNPTKGHTGET